MMTDEEHIAPIAGAAQRLTDALNKANDVGLHGTIDVQNVGRVGDVSINVKISRTLLDFSSEAPFRSIGAPPKYTTEAIQS